MADPAINKSSTSTLEVHTYLCNKIAEEADRIVMSQNFLPGRYEHIFLPSEDGEMAVIYRPELKKFHDKLSQAANEATAKVLSQQENAELFVGLLIGVARQGQDWFDQFGAKE